MASLSPDTRFLSKPCPLPFLICNNRSVLRFCYTISKYFRDLPPRLPPPLYSYAPEHISRTLESFLVRQGTSHSMEHPTATLCPGHVTKQIAFQTSTLGECFLAVRLAWSGKVHTPITWQFTCNFNCQQLTSSITSASVPTPPTQGPCWVSRIILSYLLQSCSSCKTVLFTRVGPFHFTTV